MGVAHSSGKRIRVGLIQDDQSIGANHDLTRTTVPADHPPDATIAQMTVVRRKLPFLGQAAKRRQWVGKSLCRARAPRGRIEEYDIRRAIRQARSGHSPPIVWPAHNLGVVPDMGAAVKLANEKLAWWRKARDRPVTMPGGDGIIIVRMPSRPREQVQVLAVVSDNAAVREWLLAHGYTE